MQIKPGMWSSKDWLFRLFRFVFLFLWVGRVMVSSYIYAAAKHDFHIIWYTYRLAVMRRLPLLESELLIFPKHTRSLMYCSIWSFLSNDLSTICFPFSFGHCMFSVLRFTALESSFFLSSKCPFIWLIRNNLSWKWRRTYHIFNLVYPMTLQTLIMSNFLTRQ